VLKSSVHANYKVIGTVHIDQYISVPIVCLYFFLWLGLG